MKRRDMTKGQFVKECDKRGIRLDHLGYFLIAPNSLVYARNGGTTRRAQLAYLIAEQRKLYTPDDIPEAIGEGFVISPGRSSFYLTCKVCGGRWSHPAKPLEVGTVLNLLNHKAKHDSR